jgi:hypothetical protein
MQAASHFSFLSSMNKVRFEYCHAALSGKLKMLSGLRMPNSKKK